MPELPEVETTRRGIAPHLVGKTVDKIIIRQRQLRWPVPAELESSLQGQMIRSVQRRAKYLLLGTDAGHALLHLGMSGSLRIVPKRLPVQKHDHIDMHLDSGYVLRFTDPRRFGALLWTCESPERHPLLCHLGPEPLEQDFSADYLYALSRGRRAPIKAFIMDGRVVVGVGNIYASEALFMAGVSPLRAAGRISSKRYAILVDTIREVLAAAIAHGGTTLRDFVGGEGNPGYFRQQLQVYERAGLPCRRCDGTVRQRRLGQRSTYYCPGCQH